MSAAPRRGALLTDRTPPSEDAVVGVALVAVTFAVAVASGAVLVAVGAGLVLALVALTLV